MNRISLPSVWKRTKIPPPCNTRNVADPDPGSGAFLTPPGSGILDGEKIRIRDPGRTSQIIFPRALKKFLELKILKLLYADPGSRILNLFYPGSGIWNEKFGSGPQGFGSALI
jgi:hypothetical protein